MTKINYKIILFTAILLSVLLKLHVLPLEIQGNHAWRQSKTALNIRNFVRHDSNILNPRVAHFNYNDSNIRRMEFPLMQWIIAMEHKLFGEKILYTRITVLIISLFSLLAMFQLCALLMKSKFWAAVAVWILSFSPVFFYQSVNPIPDNLALCFSLFFLYYYDGHNNQINNHNYRDHDIHRFEVLDDWVQIKTTVEIPSETQELSWNIMAENLLIDHAIIAEDTATFNLDLDPGYMISNHFLGQTQFSTK